MKDLLAHADEIPVTLLVALAYVTLAFLTQSYGIQFAPADLLAAWGQLTALEAADGEPWRLLTSAFLHGNLIHVAMNLLFLLSLAPTLERTMGSVRFATLYVVAAIGGSLAVCLIYDPRQPVVGGSGALFGMMGALVAWNMHSGRHLFSFLEFEGPRRLLSLIAVNLALGLLIPFVSNTGHVGGLIAGFAVAFLFLAPVRERSAVRRPWQVACCALFASLLFWSVLPATRWDRLWNESVVTEVPDRRAALQRAAAMSFYGTATASDFDVARFYAEAVNPPESGRRRGG